MRVVHPSYSTAFALLWLLAMTTTKTAIVTAIPSIRAGIPKIGGLRGGRRLQIIDKTAEILPPATEDQEPDLPTEDQTQEMLLTEGQPTDYVAIATQIYDQQASMTLDERIRQQMELKEKEEEEIVPASSGANSSRGLLFNGSRRLLRNVRGF